MARAGIEYQATYAKQATASTMLLSYTQCTTKAKTRNLKKLLYRSRVPGAHARAEEKRATRNVQAGAQARSREPHELCHRADEVT